MDKDNINTKENEFKSEVENEKKIEICYTCGKKFDMNKEEGAHYHYGEFPMCGYCSNFYGFYQKDLTSRKSKEIL